MPRRERGIIKKIAAFGEGQFQETGASKVEVLRVKASTIRNYFKQLRGIRYLVSVIYLDRVRVYFFAENGIMLLGENLKPDQYQEIRQKSRLVKKYEKPTPPTDLEIRMELTEHFRDLLSKSIKKVARYLNETPPDFPSIYLSSENLETSGQNFGMRIEDDGAYLVEQEISNSPLAQGIALRIAFLLLTDESKTDTKFAQILSNCIAYALTDEKTQSKWKDRWLKETKGSEEMQYLGHFIRHIPVYSDDGFSRMLSVINRVPDKEQLKKWIKSLEVIHSTFQCSLGPGAPHVVSKFCRSLHDVNSLLKKKDTLAQIHLAPRAICNTVPLNYQISLGWDEKLAAPEDLWIGLSLREGNETKFLNASPGEKNTIQSYEYYLNITDIFPKTKGLGSHGKDIVLWALEKLGVSQKRDETISADLQFRDVTASPTEIAVLERLATGDLGVLANSLIGSPKRIKSLVQSGALVIVPDFNHLGITPNLLIDFEDPSVIDIIKRHSLEMTLLKTKNNSIAIVAAPSEWGRMLLGGLSDLDCCVWPIIDYKSPRKWLREEVLFPDIDSIEAWH